MNVLCNCGSYHETTEAFDPSRRPHGGMFRLKEPYRSNGWESFPEHEGVTGDALECPNCGAPYGYPVRVDEPILVDAQAVEAGCREVNLKMEATEKAIQEHNTDRRILELHAQGKRPKEIAKELGLSSHMKVVARLKAMGEK